MGFEPAQCSRQVHVRTSYASLLNHKRHQRGGVAIGSLGGRRFLALFLLAERFERPATVRLLLAPDLSENGLPIGVRQ